METQTTQQKQPLPLRAMLEALEKVLRAQLEEHQKLLALLERKREAIRLAKLDDIAALTEEERAIVGRVVELERGRQTLVQRIAEQICPDAKSLPSITSIAEQADEPLQSRLLGIAAQLREIAVNVRQKSSVVRSAVEALSNHINGVMHSVHAALSRAGVYGRHGKVTSGAQLEYSVDVKS